MFDWKSQSFPGYRPVHEPFMTKIVDVHWKTKKAPFAYTTLFYSIYRKYVSMGGEVLLTNDFEALSAWAIANERPGGGFFDFVSRMNITFANFTWPSPPYPPTDDRPPNMGHDNFAVYPGVTGAPYLPGVISNAGWNARFGAGSVPTGITSPGGNQGADQSPNIRAVGNGVPVPIANMKRPELFPQPPDYRRLGVVYVPGMWEAPTAFVQIYGVTDPYSEAAQFGGINHDQPEFAGFLLDFTNTRIEFSGGKRARAVAYAPVPKQEGLTLFEPPFSDSHATAVAPNSGLHRADFHVVFEPMTDEETANDSVGNENRGQLAENAVFLGGDPLVPEPGDPPP